MKLAEFRCWACGHEWSDKPGPNDSLTKTRQNPSGEPRTCRRCGHPYMTWLNYERDFAPKRKDNP